MTAIGWIGWMIGYLSDNELNTKLVGGLCNVWATNVLQVVCRR